MHPQSSENQDGRGRRKSLVNITVVLMLILLLALGAWLVHNHRQQKEFIANIPAGLRQEYSFPIYYPSHMPAGYTFKEGSDEVQGPLVFYTLENGKKRIIISEQKAPSKSSSLSFPNSTRVNTPYGQAIVGTSTVGNLVALNTKTTLINMSASKDTPSDVLVDIIRNMRQVH